MRIRVSNVGVGPRHTFGLATTHGALPRLAWLSGDIYLDRGAQEFLALDREGFTNTPAIEELNDFFRDALRRVEHKLTEIDVKIKEIEAEVGLKVHGGGPRPRLPVESRRDLIESRVQELTNRGFSVERVKGPREAKPQKETKTPAAKPVRRDLRDDPGQDGPIEIDRSSRTIRVFEDHPGLVDKLVTAQGDFDLRYDRWDYSSADWPACRLDNDLLVVNSDYPLFKSRSHGRLFLRLAANVVIVLADSANGQELSRRLLLSLAEESKDLA